MRKTQQEYHNTWRKKHGEEHAKVIEYRQFSNYYVTAKGRAAHMLNNARARAKHNGVNCTLTREWIQERLERGICEVTSIPFVLQMNGGRGHNVNSFSPSVDRIIQHGDYSPENCRLTCWIYNRARGAFPPNDLDRMIDALKSR
jgi:hypothetical protein